MDYQRLARLQAGVTVAAERLADARTELELERERRLALAERLQALERRVEALERRVPA